MIMTHKSKFAIGGLLLLGVGLFLADHVTAQNDGAKPEEKAEDTTVKATPPAPAPAAKKMDFGFPVQNYKIDRYADVWEKSPFEIEIVEVVPEVKEPDNFKDLAIAGYRKSGNQYYVTLVNIKTNERQYVATGQLRICITS